MTKKEKMEMIEEITIKHQLSKRKMQRIEDLEKEQNILVKELKKLLKDIEDLTKELENG